VYSVSCANALEANWEASWKVRWRALALCKPRSKSSARVLRCRFRPIFLEIALFFAPFSPGATQQSPIDFTMRSVLFAGLTVAFDSNSVLFGRLSVVFAAVLCYLLGWAFRVRFRVGVQGADLVGPEIALLAKAPLQDNLLDPYWLGTIIPYDRFSLESALAIGSWARAFFGQRA